MIKLNIVNCFIYSANINLLYKLYTRFLINGELFSHGHVTLLINDFLTEIIYRKYEKNNQQSAQSHYSG